jgi:hypothetical protein
MVTQILEKLHIFRIPVVVTPKFPIFFPCEIAVKKLPDTFLDLYGQSSPRAEARAVIVTVIKVATFSMVLSSRLTSARSSA